MASASRRRAVAAHRRPAASRTLVRVEIRTSKGDSGLIKALADALRREPNRARAIRSILERALIVRDSKTLFDVFGSHLPDTAISGVFDQPRQRRRRKVVL